MLKSGVAMLQQLKWIKRVKKAALSRPVSPIFDITREPRRGSSAKSQGRIVFVKRIVLKILLNCAFGVFRNMTASRRRPCGVFGAVQLLKGI